jgi:hypothetical protein
MPARVVPTERPDFLARLTAESAEFGVEVAEFFDSEVEARLRRLPGYAADLLDGAEFRHKEDRRQLTVEANSSLAKRTPPQKSNANGPSW